MSIAITDRIARYKAWLNREPVSRPLIGLLWEPEIRTLPAFLDAVGSDPILPEQIRIEQFLPHIERAFQRSETLVTDMIQPFAPAFSIPWVEGIVGCTIVGSTESVNVEPMLDSYDDRPPIVFDSGNPWFQKLLEFTRALVKQSDTRFPVAHPPLHRPLYTLSQMRGQERFCEDLIENPSGVKKIMGELSDLWLNIVEACMALIPPFHGGYSTWAKMWAPGCAINLQNEFAPMISPQMYKEFVLPLDRKAAARYPYSSFHLHGVAQHQVDVLLELDDLTVQQLVLEHNVGGPPLSASLPVARRILGKKPLLLVADDIETAELCIRELPAPGLCVQVVIIPRDYEPKHVQWVESHCTPK